MVRYPFKNNYSSPKIFFGLFMCLFLIACSNYSKEEGLAILKKSVRAHGGMKKFNKLNALSFNKVTRLFKEDGSLEQEIVQKQSFQLHPVFLAKIEWEKNGTAHEVFYDGSEVIKTINGQMISDSLKLVTATNLAKAASFVFFQPFKLLKDETMLMLEGEIDLNDSTDVSVVSVKFPNDESTDRWRFYFNDDNLLVANSVAHGETISLIENLELQDVHGLLFNKHRKSFYVDDLLNKKYLRAEYFYNDLAATMIK